ncbi:MAG: tetratricopeptide repeat protein [Pseudoxanthomonas sp.]
MRPPERAGAWILLLAVLLLLAGCSRLTFVKTKPEIVKFKRQESSYKVKDSDATTLRLKERERVDLAWQRLQAGDLDAAQREAKAVLKASDASVAGHTILAIVETRRGRAEAAGPHYRRAAELAPADPGVANNYGAWLCSGGYHAESLVWFDRAIANPAYATPASALANAGGCALKAGQYERAERDLRKAVSLEPRNAYALESMAANEHRLGRDFEARAFIERRLAAAPADASVLQLAADIENRLGDKAAASRYLQRLGTEFPKQGAANSGDSARP